MCLSDMNFCMLTDEALLFELLYQLVFDLKAALEHPSTHRADFTRYPAVHSTCQLKERSLNTPLLNAKEL